VKFLFPLLLILFVSCRQKNKAGSSILPAINAGGPLYTVADSPTVLNSIHVFTALCDNKYQGIVPVPAIMGNGQDPDNNLYWGWGYGIRTYFNKSKEWKIVTVSTPGYPVQERLVYKSTIGDYYLVADAYDGRAMKECLQDYLKALSGNHKKTIIAGNQQVGIYGHARLLAFVGHNGLMDFNLPETYLQADSLKREGIVLACYSKSYFSSRFKDAGAYPLLWTSNLFGPEAYSLHDALSGYIRGENAVAIQTRAATVYAKFTKCSVHAARRLLVTGW
jgi:hypothetical protein